jgi:phosphohistidine phosphatase
VNLLFIRHAIAEKREEWNEIHRSDFFRPVTKRGIIRFTDVALGLSLFVPKIDQILTSHYTRAVQTAEILHAQYRDAELKYTKELNPETKVQKMVDLIQELIHENDDHDELEPTVAIIGHQPELTQIISMLLINKKDINIRLKKGGAALLNIRDSRPELKWLMSGRQLVQFSSVYEELKAKGTIELS